MGQIFVRFISIVLMEFLHQKSYVYAPKNNSIAERKRHHILSIARALDFNPPFL